jgi:enamine deaminase RidA (YjgF/YER057c/UK114 family)
VIEPIIDALRAKGYTFATVSEPMALEMNEEHFPVNFARAMPQPTRTTVGVDSLPAPIAVELKVIASA